MLFVVFVTASAYRTSTSVVHAPAPGTAPRSLQQGGLRAQEVDVASAVTHPRRGHIRASAVSGCGVLSIQATLVP